MLVATCLALLSPAWAQQGGPSGSSRVALMIANAVYGPAAPLDVAQDGRAAGEALRQGGFDVVMAENASRAGLEQAITAFTGKLRRGGVAVVFYAGHAVQARGRNFLVPVDASSGSAQEVARQVVDLDILLDALIVSRPASALVMLDASRANPWQQALDSRLKGLAAVEPMAAIAVAATAPPGQTAADGPGRGTGAVAEWLKAIRTPNLEMAAALTRVKAAVARQPRRHPAFWTSSAPPAGLVVTVPGAPAVVAQTSRAVIPPPAPSAQTGQPDPYELSFWDTIRTSENPAEYRAYLNAYPTGLFAPLAKTREQFFRDRAGGAVASAAPPAAPAPRAAPAGARTLRDCENCPEITLLPAGSFEMGSNELYEFEKPVRTVTIRSGFYIGTNEVTFQEWDACVDQGGCAHRPNDRNLGRGRRPVTDVSWVDANAYAAWLSARTGRRYRLPTEAEWEYAARAGATATYPWGATVDKDKANCNGCTAQPRRQTVDVGRFPANGFGLYDMAGNAAEWVADCWSENYRAAPRDGSAYTTPACRERVLRGGSFNNDPRYLRSAARFKYEADVRFYTNGFRVARDQ